MTEKLFFSGMLSDLVKIYNDLRVKDQYKTEFIDLNRGNSREIEFLKIPDSVNPKKHYLRIKTEDYWVWINRKEFLRILRFITREYKEKEKEFEKNEHLKEIGPGEVEDLKDPYFSEFSMYIENTEIFDYLHLVWKFSKEESRKTFTIILTPDRIETAKKSLMNVYEQLVKKQNEQKQGDQK